MTWRALAVGLLASTVWTATASAPRVSREALAALERKFDQKIRSYSINDPFALLGTTRGVYLRDYGVVFTTELNLVAAAVVTPFRPAFTKAQIKDLHTKKLKRLDELKGMMRAMLVESALALKTVPPEQQVAIGVTLFRFSWEDSRGIPAQILMQARRRNLLDFEAGKLSSAGLDAAIRIEEF